MGIIADLAENVTDDTGTGKDFCLLGSRSLSLSKGTWRFNDDLVFLSTGASTGSAQGFDNPSASSGYNSGTGASTALRQAQGTAQGTGSARGIFHPWLARFSALITALIEATMISVSTPTPHFRLPPASSISIYAAALALWPPLSACSW